MVIGGIANLFWGIPRATLDIDITIQVKGKICASLIQKLRDKFRLRVKNPLDFIAKTSVLPVEDPNGIQIDIIFARLPYEFQAIRRSKRIQVNGHTIQVCSPEDLIIHKIVSDRIQDQQDVRGIVRSFGPKLNRKYLDPIVRNLAKTLAKPELFTFYLNCFKVKGALVAEDLDLVEKTYQEEKRFAKPVTSDWVKKAHKRQ